MQKTKFRWRQVLSLLLASLVCIGAFPVIPAHAQSMSSASWMEAWPAGMTMSDDYISIHPQTATGATQSWQFTGAGANRSIFTDTYSAKYDGLVDEYAVLSTADAVKYNGQVHMLVSNAGRSLSTGKMFDVYLTFYFSTQITSASDYVFFGASIYDAKGIAHRFSATAYEVKYEILDHETGALATPEKFRIALTDIDNGQYYGFKLNNGSVDDYLYQKGNCMVETAQDLNPSAGYMWFYNTDSNNSEDGLESQVVIEASNTNSWEVIMGPSWDNVSYSSHITSIWANHQSDYSASSMAYWRNYMYSSTGRIANNYGGWAIVSGDTFGPVNLTQVKKYVSDENEYRRTANTIAAAENPEASPDSLSFYYDIDFFLPDMHEEFYPTKLVITDTIPTGLRYQSCTFLYSNAAYAEGTVKSTKNISGQNLTVSLTSNTLKTGSLYGQKLILRVYVEIDPDNADTYVDGHVFTNKATITTNYGTYSTNEVTTTISVEPEPTPDPITYSDLYHVYWDQNYDGGGVASSLQGKWHLKYGLEVKDKLSVSTSGGSGSSSNTATQDVDTTIQIIWGYPNEPYRDGYTFLGWSRDREATESTPETYSVTSLSEIEGIRAEIDEAETVLASAEDADEIAVAQLSLDAANAKWDALMERTYSTVTRNPFEPYGPATFYAVWKPAEHTIVWNGNGGQMANGSLEMTTTQNHGEALEFPDAPTRTGYTFEGWYLYGVQNPSIEVTSDTIVEKSITYYARWTPEPVYVTYYDNTTGYSKVGQQEYKYSEPLNLLKGMSDTNGLYWAGWDRQDGLILNSSVLTEHKGAGAMSDYWTLDIHGAWSQKTVDYTATVYWEDASNNDGARPREITLGLVSSDSNNSVVQTKTLTYDGGSAQSVVFSDLPITIESDDGVSGITIDNEKIQYSVALLSYKDVAGETYSIQDTSATSGILTMATLRSTQTATNSYATTYRYEYVGGELKQTAELASKEYSGDTSADTWTINFGSYPKYHNGREAVYLALFSSDLNALIPKDEELYTASYVGLTLTASRIINKGSVSTQIQWVDDGDNDGKRPASVKVQLYRGEEKIGQSVLLTAQNDWSTTWDNLPVYSENEEGTPAEYRVDVETPEGYTAIYMPECGRRSAAGNGG